MGKLPEVNMFMLYFQLWILVVMGSLVKKRDIESQSEMGNVFQNIFQMSANSMATANKMGTPFNANCFSGMGMTDLKPIQPQMSQSNFLACRCLQTGMNGCPTCPCLNENGKKTTKVTTFTANRTNATKQRTQSVNIETTPDVKNSSTAASSIMSQSSKNAMITRNFKTNRIKRSTISSTMELITSTSISKIHRKLHQPEVPVYPTKAYNIYKSGSTSISLVKSTNKIGKYHQRLPEKEIVKETSFTISIALGVALFFVIIVAVVFCYLWRKTLRLLKRERNELYFTEKSFRTGSLTSMGNSSSILASIWPKDRPPDLPVRTPPLTPTAPPVMTSTPTDITRVGQTSFKIPPDEVKNDYLELI